MLPTRILNNNIDSGEFISSDAENLHEKNKNKLGDIWFYTNQKISYDLNSDGFRGPEFNTIDWSNTIAVFGCSYIFGTGLAETSTISNCIKSKTKCNVINLGVEGLSNYSILHNMIQFKKKYNPKICIILWTDASRITYQTKNKDYYITAWEVSTGEIRKVVPDIKPSYLLSEDILQKDQLYQEVASMIPDVYTLHSHEIDTISICKEHFGVKDVKKLDMQLVNRYLARDIGWSKINECYFAHPGIEITQRYSDKIWNSLPKKTRMELKI